MGRGATCGATVVVMGRAGAAAKPATGVGTIDVERIGDGANVVVAAGVANPARGAVVMAGGAEYVVVGSAVEIPGVAMYVG
jgi:hypothetical protein